MSETAPIVVVADDDAAAAHALVRGLVAVGCSVTRVATTEDALEMVHRQRPDLLLLASSLAGRSGFDVCKRLKADPGTRLIPILMLSGTEVREPRNRSLRVGADDCMPKPVDIAQLRVRVASLLYFKRLTNALNSAQAVMLSLAMAIEGRDPFTDGHCQRVSRYAIALGRALSLDQSQIEVLHRGGFLHDIGKLSVPDATLVKNGPLSGSEWAIVEQHPVVGEQICRELRSLHDVCPIVRSHHERLDGSGYPDGLTGEDIPITAQIVSLADAYDSLTTDRPYRPAVAVDVAIGILRREATRGWRRSDLVETMAQVLKFDETIY
jgi:putative two-component system response regulator